MKWQDPDHLQARSSLSAQLAPWAGLLVAPGFPCWPWVASLCFSSVIWIRFPKLPKDQSRTNPQQLPGAVSQLQSVSSAAELHPLPLPVLPTGTLLPQFGCDCLDPDGVHQNPQLCFFFVSESPGQQKALQAGVRLCSVGLALMAAGSHPQQT